MIRRLRVCASELFIVGRSCLPARQALSAHIVCTGGVGAGRRAIPDSITPSADIEGGEGSAHTITGLGNPLPETSLLVLFATADLDRGRSILVHAVFSSGLKSLGETTRDANIVELSAILKLCSQSLGGRLRGTLSVA